MNSGPGDALSLLKARMNIVELDVRRSCDRGIIDRYVSVLNKYLDQFLKIESMKTRPPTYSFHQKGMETRLLRLRGVLSGILDTVVNNTDSTIVTLIHQFTLERTIDKLTADLVVRDNENVKLNPEAIVNLTDVHIPHNVLTMLSLGPRFCFPTKPQSVDWARTAGELEELIENNLLPMEISKVSGLLADRLKQARTAISGSHDSLPSGTQYIMTALEDTDRFIASMDKDILILNADKGNKTVIMHRNEYDAKVVEMMSDVTTYSPIVGESHGVEGVRRKHDSLVSEFIKLKLIPENQRWKYVKRHYTCPKFYGLPKTHKPDYPLRPITSTIGSIGYELASFLASFLKSFDELDPSHIINSLQLKQFLDTLDMPTGHILVSFDVVSMFTNIPVGIALRSVRKRMLSMKCNHKIVNLVYRSLEFILTDCAFFSAGGAMYRQIRGLAMGSPLSPILSRFVMSDLIWARVTARPDMEVAPFLGYMWMIRWSQ